MDDLREDIRFAVEQDYLFSPDQLTWSRSVLIDDVADVINEQMAELISEDVRIERIWLEKIFAELVDSGKVLEGYIDVVLYLSSHLYNRTRAISITYPISSGIILKATYFRDSSGNIIPFNKTNILNFIRLGIVVD